MNRDDIIRIAQEVSGVEFPASMDGVKIGMGIEHLERFANLVAAAEREWQGLTDDEVAQAMYRADAIFTGPMQFKFAKEIEAKLKEKNT
jgi:hypothetical protein